MNKHQQSAGAESRWPPILVVLLALALLAVLPRHVYVLPVWVSRLAGLAIIAAMAAAALTRGSALWLRIERTTITLIVAAFVVNTIVELADMIGIVTLDRGGVNTFSLLSSSVAIWVANVLLFSLLYWQVDGGGPQARASGLPVTPDWLFPRPEVCEQAPPAWRPLFLDYLFLGYTTATAFSPTDALPLTRRAKLLMMIESTISLVTTVIVLSRAINTIPG